MSWGRVLAGLEALGTGAASPRPAASFADALAAAGRFVDAPTQSKRAFDEQALEDAAVLGDEHGVNRLTTDPTPPPPLDLLKKWVSYTKKLDSRGDYVGTGHKRIAIPKTNLSEDEIKRLGFQNVLAGIPETGQDRFRSFRRVDSNHHLHSHPDYWTLHEDEHPSMTMALQTAEGPLQAAKAIASGTSHVVGEGVPGAYYYLKGQILGGDGMVDRLGRLARIRKKNVKAAATAVVVKGNPKFITGNEKADKFYAALQAALQNAGYDVSFDPGEDFTEPPPADLWVGHSRGVGRLRFAPPGTRTIAVGSNAPGAVNHPDDDVLTPFHQTGGTPPDAHYELTPEMIAAMGLGKAAGVIAHVAGPSGSGKTTLMNDLASKHPGLVTKDLDDFDEQAEAHLGYSGINKKDYTDEMLTALAKVRQQTMDDWVAAQGDRPVVLGGHHWEGDHVLRIPDSAERFMLSTSPLLSAWRAYRRSQSEAPEHRRRLSELPSDWREAKSDANRLKRLGYVKSTPAEIESAVVSQLPDQAEPQAKTAEARLYDLLCRSG